MNVRGIFVLLLTFTSLVGFLPSAILVVGQQNSYRILFDESHDPYVYTIGNSKTPATIKDGFSSLATSLNGVGFRVESLKSGPITSSALAGVSVLVVPPSNGWISSAEQDAIIDFVSKGGGLLLLGESTYAGDASIVKGS